jgi:DNA adenine methylase
MMFDIRQRDKPILKWAGGKSSLLPQLAPLFPERFNRYVEPFLGGAAVFLSLRAGVPARLNEINPELFNLYSVLRDQTESLMSSLRRHSELYCEEYYYQVRSTVPRDPVECAARTLFLNKTGYNGLYRQNQKGEFNVPFGHRKVCPSLFNEENMRSVARRLAQAEISNCDFEDVLLQAGEGDFIYCDPPYEPLSATSSFNSYNGNGFSRAEQERLARCCSAASRRGAVVAVSNSTAPFILELYSGWQLHTIKARRAINSMAQRRGAIEEVLAVVR